MVFAASFEVLASDHFSKSAVHPFSGNAMHAGIDPFANSSGTLFTVNFSIMDYPGGKLTFDPVLVVNSTMAPDTISAMQNAYNQTVHVINGSSTSQYGVEFFSNAMIVPLGSTASSGSYNIFVPQTGSSGAAGPIILWNNSGNWGVPMESVYLSPGNYHVTYYLKFSSTEPPIALMNLTGGSATVNLISFGISSTTSYFGTLSMQNLTVFPK